MQTVLISSKKNYRIKKECFRDGVLISAKLHPYVAQVGNHTHTHNGIN